MCMSEFWWLLRGDIKFHPSWAELRGAFSGGEAHKAKEQSGASGHGAEEAFQQPAEMETLGGPHAVEQKQTNGLNG